MHEFGRISRRHVLHVGATAMLAGITSRVPALGQDKPGKLPIRIVNAAGNANFVMQDLLQSQGILDALGLQPSFQNVQDGAKAAAMVVKGEADACMQAGFGPVLPEIEKGARIKVVSGGALLAPQTVYTTKADIRTVKDLVGRTVGTGAMGAALHQKMVALLRKKGVDDKSVKFVNVGSSANIFKAVVAGQVDAGPGDLDVLADIAKHGVYTLADSNMWTELSEYTNQAAFTSDAAIAGKRDAVVRAIASYARLYRFLQSPQSKEVWITTAAKIKKTAVPADADPQWKFYQDAKPFPPGIAISEARVRYIQELNVSMGLQKQVLPFAQVADMSLAADALKLIA